MPNAHTADLWKFCCLLLFINFMMIVGEEALGFIFNDFLIPLICLYHLLSLFLSFLPLGIETLELINFTLPLSSAIFRFSFRTIHQKQLSGFWIPCLFYFIFFFLSKFSINFCDSVPFGLPDRGSLLHKLPDRNESKGRSEEGERFILRRRRRRWWRELVGRGQRGIVFVVILRR